MARNWTALRNAKQFFALTGWFGIEGMLLMYTDDTVKIPQSVLRTFEGEMEDIRIMHELIEADEYIEFLGRTNLGQQYPMERFAERIQTLVKSVQISLIARNPQQEIVGVCFGLTDFAYWLFLTDLGVDRRYERRGIGKLLVEAAHARAGGEKNIVMFTNVNDEAIPFYQKLGMTQSSDIFAKWNIDWTPFEVVGLTRFYRTEAGSTVATQTMDKTESSRALD